METVFSLKFFQIFLIFCRIGDMKRPKTPRIPFVIALICLFIALAALTPATAAETYPARVRDISDRAYESAVLDLIDSAKGSVVVSMYIMVPSEEGPVGLLMKALEKALDRGVSVELYLNTDFAGSMTAPTFEEMPFKRLEEKGAVIKPVSQKYMLHDKLVIVDSRYVVEGSHNWSIKALKQNHESATLIDSPDLAREKSSRVRELPLEKNRLARLRKLEELRTPPPLPENTLIPLPKALLEDKNLLPRLLSNREKRTFNAYFLLILSGYAVGRGDLPGEFPVNLGELADDLKVSKLWFTEQRRWQKVADILRELRDIYGLIDVEFRYGPEEWIRIKRFPGGTFPVGLDFFEADYLNSTTTRAKYVYLIKALLKEEGKTLDSYTRERLAEKYNIGLSQLYRGLREIKN
jgi:hypothetical protein